MLARDFGFRPAGKSAPMRSDAGDRRSSSVRSTTSSPLFDDPDGTLFNDVFGGPPKYTNTSGNSNKSASMNDFNYDSIFKSGNESKSNNNNDDNMKTSSLPVYDKPVYDEDIFDGLPGVKSKSVSSSTARFEDDVFATMTLPPQRTDNKSHFDDLLGNLGRKEKVAEPKSGKSSGSTEFDDLLAGFGSGSPATSSRYFVISFWSSFPIQLFNFSYFWCNET